MGSYGHKRVAKDLIPIDVSSLANSKYTTLKEPKSKKEKPGSGGHIGGSTAVQGGAWVGSRR